MKLYFLLIVLISTSGLIAQPTKFPNLKLSFESTTWNSEKFKHEKVIYLDSVPKMSYSFEANGREFLVAFFLRERFSSQVNVIATYVNFANTWQRLQQIELEYTNITTGLKFYVIDNKRFIYFESLDQPGGASLFTSYNFHLYDVLENKLYSLVCHGLMGGDSDKIKIENPEFDFEDLLDYPNILAILEKEASNSDRIIR
jgi:hypothetical protein